MAAVAVTSSTLRKNTWKTVRAVLYNTISGVDTRVYGAYPQDAIAFPLIVIGNTNKGEPMSTMNQNVENEVSVLVTVYTKAAETLDTYMDDIQAKLEVYSWSTYNLYLPLTEGIIDNEGTGPFFDANNNRIYSKSLTLTLKV